MFNWLRKLFRPKGRGVVRYYDSKGREIGREALGLKKATGFSIEKPLKYVKEHGTVHEIAQAKRYARQGNGEMVKFVANKVFARKGNV